MSAIKCKQCGHENDLTRVFCQNCGGRLERSEGDAPTMAGTTRVPTKDNPLTKKRSSGGKGAGYFLGAFVRGVISCAIIGAFLAVLIQVSRRPDGIPAQEPANQEQAVRFYELAKTNSESPFPRIQDVTEAQINNYLATRILPGTSEGASVISPKFQRALVTINPGGVRLVVEQRWLGWPVYFYMDTVPTTAGGGSVTGAGAGRIQLPTPLVPIVERVIVPVFSSIPDATAPLKTAGKIDLGNRSAKVSWPGVKR